MSEKRDYYEVLGVARDADVADLKRAYRKLAVEFHPDRNPGNPEAEARFKEAAEAYGVLSDPEKRALYDRFGHEAPRQGGFGGGFRDVGDIFSAFSDIFGDMFGGMGRRGPAPGADVEAQVELTLQEVAAGVTKDVVVRRRASCTTCSGSGAAPGTSPETCPQCGGRGQVVHSQGFLMITTACPRCRGAGQVVRKPCPACKGAGLELVEDHVTVTIPAGVEDGSTLRLAGKGETSGQGGRPGNLYIALRVADDPRFERDGADLHTEVSVSFPQAALGAEVKIETLEGEASIELHPGTQPGETLVLRGQGLPHLRERGKGDLVVHVRVVVPTKLTKEQEEHLRAYAAAGGDEARPSDEKRGFFGRKKKKS